MTRFDQPIYKYACHEANYSLTNILRGGRTQFWAGAEKTRYGITRARKVLILFRVFVVPCSVYYLSMKIPNGYALVFAQSD